MILIDTSVWVDHLRVGDAALERLLDSGAVLGHPFVIGELALGNLASARLTADAKLWTRDGRLRAVAMRLGLAAAPRL